MPSLTRQALFWLMGLGSLGLKAQTLHPVKEAAFIFLAPLGEWHLGITQAPSDLHDTITDGRRRTLGLAFPIQVAPGWQLRPRYDDGAFSNAYDHQTPDGMAKVELEVKQRHYGFDVVYARVPSRLGARRPFVYAGGGLGLMQTWHERSLTGFTGSPSLPLARSEETRSLAGRILVGVQIHPALGVEAQFQTSTHDFEGRRYHDTCATLGVRVWPAALVLGRSMSKGD